MVIGLKHNILKMLREQAPTPAPPAAAPPPAPVDPNAPPAAPSVPGTPVDPNAPPVDPNAPPVDPNAPPSDGAEGEEDDGAESPEGQPKVDENDPVGAVEEAALETAKTTIDPQLILRQLDCLENSPKSGQRYLECQRLVCTLRILHSPSMRQLHMLDKPALELRLCCWHSIQKQSEAKQQFL